MSGIVTLNLPHSVLGLSSAAPLAGETVLDARAVLAVTPERLQTAVRLVGLDFSTEMLAIDRREWLTLNFTRLAKLVDERKSRKTACSTPARNVGWGKGDDIVYPPSQLIIMMAGEEAA